MKTFLMLGLMVLMAATITACGGSSGTPAAAVVVDPNANAFTSEVLVLATSSPDTTEAIDIAAYSATAPDNTEPLPIT